MIVPFDQIGLPAGYAVRDDGEVISYRHAGGERVLKRNNSAGYPAVSIKVDGIRHTYTVHRLLALAFLPNAEGKPTVNHKDGDKGNFALSNLEWSTFSENNQHAYTHGLARITAKRRQVSHTNALRMIKARRRFTDEDVRSIRHMAASGKSIRAISRLFKCSHSTIGRICSGDSYKTDLGEIQ